MLPLIVILFPIGAFAALYILIKNLIPATQAPMLLLRSAVAWSIYLVIGLEALSLIRAINRPGLILGWSLPCLICLVYLAVRRRRGLTISWPHLSLRSFKQEPFPGLLILIILAVTWFVAWKTPIQTQDSLTYHLARVAHWAQDSSIQHFATGIERQNTMSPGAEMIVLNDYVLYGGDRLANFVQWFAMLGSLVGVALIASHLGASAWGQWLAALIAATIPIGIVESSSTSTDYVVAFWLVCMAAEVIGYSLGGGSLHLFFASLAAGLALLTKPTALPYLLPFAGWIAVDIFRRQRLTGLIKWGLAAVLLVGLLNAGFLGRNLSTYGNLSTEADLSRHTLQLPTPQGVISSLLKNIGSQTGLPGNLWLIRKFNAAQAILIIKVHEWMGLELNDPRTTGEGPFAVRAPSTQEDLVSNPYHALLFLLLLFGLFFLRKRLSKTAILYTLLLASGFILFSAIFKWLIFTIRYHLPFFVLAAPALAAGIASLRVRLLGYGLAFGLFLACLPWLFSIDSRPLIPIQGRSITGSILSQPRSDLYFTNTGGPEAYYRVADELLASGCNQIGLMLGGDDPEYLFWMLLNAPRSDLHIEWIVSDPSARYESPDFQPCAILAKGLPAEMSVIRGLPLLKTIADYQIYQK